MRAAFALLLVACASSPAKPDKPREPPAEATRLTEEVEKLIAAGESEKALPLARRALKLDEDAVGPVHAAIADACNDLGVILNSQRDFDGAEILFRRALGLFEKVYGPDDPNVGATLSNLGRVLAEKGDLAGAEDLERRALTLVEKTMGNGSLKAAEVANNLAHIVEERGNYPEAKKLLWRVYIIKQKTLGDLSQQSAAALGNLALVLMKMGEYSDAETMFSLVLGTEQRMHPAEHPMVGLALANLGGLYMTIGKYADAEVYFSSALAIYRRAPGDQDLLIATTLNNLGTTLREEGEYAEAESDFRESLRIREAVLGPDHPITATSMNNLAELLWTKGDLQAAEPLYRRALAINRKAFGDEHPTVATSMSNLATLLDDKGDGAEAATLLRAALAIQEKALGTEHPSVASTLTNLAPILGKTGDAAGEESAYRRALAIDEKAFGPDAPEVATMLNNLAEAIGKRGRKEQLALERRALAIREKALGPKHPDVAKSLRLVATDLVTAGDAAAATPLYQRAAAIEERLIGTMLASGSARQKAAFFATIGDSAPEIVSQNVQWAPEDETALRLAFTTVLQRKGRVLDASANTIGALRRSASEADADKLGRLASLRSEIATLTLDGRAEDAVAKVRADAESLESELGGRFAALRHAADEIGLDAVQKRLAPGSALVEIFRYQPLLPSHGWGASRYVAYVLGATGAPRFADLGEADGIDELVGELRRRVTHSDASYAKTARELDERVMRPVRKLVGQARELYISPDGALNLVPFAALVDERNRYLIQSYGITVLTSGRDLLRFGDRDLSVTGPVVVAGPDYGASATGTSHGRRSAEMGTLQFSPLPGATREGSEVALYLPRARLLDGAEATEEAVKALRAPRVLHIATHGFFLDSLAPGGGRGGQIIQDAAPHRVPEDPLLRSGLALAGANQRKSGGEDGILTALEVAGLDLWGTQLVVLSACDTGVGTVKSGDGVYGLRRALVLAGAESQIMSLWKVDDEASRRLMVDTYRRLRDGGGRSEALRQAQLALLARPGTAHPFFWAAFMASGDPRPLARR